jgi:hypothetical protein
MKDLCLSRCRTPDGFIATSWRDGTLGALRMDLLRTGRARLRPDLGDQAGRVHG